MKGCDPKPSRLTAVSVAAMPGKSAAARAGTLVVCCALALACSARRDRGPSPLQPAPPSAPAPDAQQLEAALSDNEIPWSSTPVIGLLGEISRNMRRTEYSSKIRVDESSGYYQFDCSGLATFVLSRTKPEAFAAAQADPERRPLAKHFHRSIARVAGGFQDAGWARIERVAEAIPGDVIVWLRPREIESKDTGHIAFVARRPVPLPGYANAFLIRVIDASKSKHWNDTRSASNSTGFGFGTILLVTGPTGEPTHYSWAAHEDRLYPSSIVIGRALR